MREMFRLFSEFSTNHAKFISLLASSLRERVHEAEIYAEGRKCVIAVNRTIEGLDQLSSKFEFDAGQQQISDRLRQRLLDYRHQVGSTVFLASVEVKLITQFTLKANQAYNTANDEFLLFIDAVQESAQSGVADVQSTFNTSALLFIMILGGTIIFVVLGSTLLSRLFTSDIKYTIEALSRLAEGDINIPEQSLSRGDEFGAVNQAIQAFRKVLIQRDKAGDQLKINIVERIQVERSLRISEERFRTLYDANPLMLITVDGEGTVLSINQHGIEQLGLADNELIGSSVLDRVLPEDRNESLKMIARCSMTPGRKCQWTLREMDAEGNIIWLRVVGKSFMQDDNTTATLLVCEDITETHKLTEKLSYQATHDSLTGLVNRLEFEDRLAHALKNAKTDCSEHVLCFLDLDQFKIINDTCGHGAGDLLLIQLGQLLQANIRKGDALARLGGDEFGLLLSHCTLSTGWKIAQGLLKTIEDFRFNWMDRVYRVGVSIGVVQITEVSANTADIMASADAACYAAKDQGRNQVHVYAQNDQQMVQRRGEMEWATRIPEALEEGRFELFYQTIAPVSGGNDHGLHFELLLRMKDETGNWVMPNKFLPAAERYSLSIQLDRWVISTAFSSISPMRSERVVEQCAINISGLSLGNEEFLEFILRELRRSRVQPQTICLEITETAAIHNMDSARRFITTLKKEGITFALDDFGTGLSSLAYLRELPVDILKIDGSFIRDIARDPIQFAMVRSINDIGHLMGMCTVAEFVETQEILDKLREIGVDYAQGYHIAKPRPVSELFLAA
ncbi:MAG: EAL domain-containing protein [Gammaproteobacteria bacterium]|nr:EAL domain-containing protein [Gammaproteobacteria bacterium]